MTEIHRRRSIRLKGYDYSQAGAYFVTISAQNRSCLFGDVADGEIRLSDAGHMVEECWQEIPGHFPHADLPAFVVMPNHVHGILTIMTVVGANNHSPLQMPPPRSGTSKTIGSIIRGFKIGVTKWMRRNTQIRDIWQRNYYEHVIRNENELDHIREYIVNNPLQWAVDRENPMSDCAGRS